MSEHAPAVLKRMLALRRFPTLDRVELREVARLAESVRATTIAAGTVVADPTRAVDAVYLVIDGQLAMHDPDRTWGPDHAFGLLELLARRAAPAPIVATCETRVLQLAAYHLEDVLEDNFGILSATLRRLAGRLASDHVHHRLLELPPCGRPLGLVERLIVLRQLVPFTKARLRALSSIAQSARELTWEAGQRVVDVGHASEELHILLDGTLRVTDGRELAPGDSFGTFETLAARHHELAIDAVTSARTLACSGSSILDVIEDHTELGIGFLRACARALLDRTRTSTN
jgi:CRP-like cAMP-binding protein